MAEQKPQGPNPDPERGSETIREIAIKKHDRVEPQNDETYSLYSFSAYDDNNEQPVTEPGSNINSAKYKVPDNSILVSKLNPRINRVWRVESANKNAICSTEFIILKPNDDIPLDYLYAVLNEPTFREHLTKLTTGTSGSHQRVKQKDILDYELTKFSNIEKQTISKIYGLLEEKIRTNVEISKYLSKITQVIFKNRFIEFEPYNEFKESEIGRIPVDFHLTTMSEFAEITLGNSPKSEYYNEDGDGLPFFQGSKNFGLRYPEVEKWCTREKKLAEANDVLISIRAPVGDVNRATERCVVGRGVTSLRMKNHSNEYLYHLLEANKHKWEKYKSGTTFNSINKTDIQEFPVALPPDEEIEDFNSKVGPMEEMIRNNFEENEILANIRDTLLPKLMSGDLRINEINLEDLEVSKRV